MTTFTTMPDSQLDQDSPVTQPLMMALRDNPLAIAEGDASAPRIRTEWALQRPAAGDGSVIAHYRGFSVSGGGSGRTEDIHVAQGGSIRLRYTVSATATVDVVRVSWGVGPVTIATTTTSGLKVVDFTISRGDYIYIAATSGGTFALTDIVFSSGVDGGLIA